MKPLLTLFKWDLFDFFPRLRKFKPSAVGSKEHLDNIVICWNIQIGIMQPHLRLFSIHSTRIRRGVWFSRPFAGSCFGCRSVRNGALAVLSNHHWNPLAMEGRAKTIVLPTW